MPNLTLDLMCNPILQMCVKCNLVIKDSTRYEKTEANYERFREETGTVTN